MCRMCDQAKSRILGLDLDWGVGSAHLQPAAARAAAPFADLMLDDALSATFSSAFSSKAAAGLTLDGAGDTAGLITQDPAEVDAVALVTEDIAGDQTTTASLVVDGPRVVSTINTPGDEDWFRVELQAGVTYEFGQYQTRQGDSGVPLPDAYLELYDAAGNLIAFSDGGSPNDSIGLDALLTYKATESGTYYVNARAFDDMPLNGETGDFVGDYEVFARVSRYEPYYDLDSPLHSLDWGTKFDGTSGNPDGAEGPRPTGNEVETVSGGKNVLYYYFAREGELFVDNAANPLNLTTTIVAKGFSPWEKNAIDLALERYENVADLIYIETDDRFAADIVFVTYNGTPGIMTPSLAGRMSPPDTPSEGQTEYNAGDYRWTPEGLAPGGVFFGTLIHELGHGHGMAHPHDNGGRSSVMRDYNTPSGYVEEISTANYTNGSFDLNQGVYTMMSYEDGWEKSPYGQPRNDLGYGFIGSLMAFDIAVIQDKYGVNEEFATGDDVYYLPDENSAAQFDADGKMTKEGTSWKSIWDAGGTDEIAYAGAKDVVIDLRPATLKYEFGGGGWLSYAWGVHGGFTVANGVTIENARAGSGNDKVTGNDVANRIILSAGGNDTAEGRGGDDIFYFGAAFDGADRVDGGGGFDSVWLKGNYVLTLDPASLVAVEKIGLLSADLGGFEYNLTSVDQNVAAGATLTVDGSLLEAGEKLTFNGMAELDGRFSLVGGAADDVLVGGSGHDELAGGAGNDRLYGMSGNDSFRGGLGQDLMWGGGGADVFSYDSAAESTGLNFDRLDRFQTASDKIDLPTAVAGWSGTVGLGRLSAATFDADLASAVDGVLQANSAVLFTPTSGDFAGRMFGVVDADGDGNYQAGLDYVFEFMTPVGLPTATAAIFI